MIVQWDNKVMSSLMLYIDNKVLMEGKAFTNVNYANFYPIESKYSGLWAYSLPYKQIVGDQQVWGQGATELTNIIVDGSITSPGNNDMYGILYHKGQVLFSVDQGSVSIQQHVSIKEYNVYITTELEEDILFNTKHQTNPKVSQDLAGLKDEEETFPAIFLKNMGGHNDPLCFGGTDNVKTMARAIVLADSAFSLDAVCSILKNCARKDIPIAENIPFNSIGAFTGVIYNYGSISNAAADFATIWDVKVTKINPSELKGMDKRVFPAIVDFEIHGYGRNT